MFVGHYCWGAASAAGAEDLLDDSVVSTSRLADPTLKIGEGIVSSVAFQVVDLLFNHLTLLFESIVEPSLEEITPVRFALRTMLLVASYVFHFQQLPVPFVENVVRVFCGKVGSYCARQIEQRSL